MVLVLAVVVGVIIGISSGGTFAPLGELRIRYFPLLILGLFAQILIFTPLLGKREFVHDYGPWIYVVSLFVLLFAMLMNLHIPGMRILILGAALNALVITANGGFMPAPADQLERAGLLEGVRRYEESKSSGEWVLTNSKIADDNTRFHYLGDVTMIRLPESLPFSNVYSIGDLILAVGGAAAVVGGMHGRGRRDDLLGQESAATPPDPDESPAG